MRQYIVDAFADRPFSGNPAAVCVLPEWPEDAWMRKLASENNLSETAFLVREGSGWRLRWFTPEMEIGLCGHATLASAYVVMNCVAEGEDRVDFTTCAGHLFVRRDNDLYAMDFPLGPQSEIPVSQAMIDAFGAKPERAFLGLDLVCVFADEDMVRRLEPYQSLLAGLEGRGQHVTARGLETDCVSRSFFPKAGIPEDPVCGSAHCQIAPYWAHVLGKRVITAYQASRRGGYLFCNLADDGRIGISGKACLVAISEIQPRACPEGF